MKAAVLVLSLIMAAVHIESARHHKRHRTHGDDNEATTDSSVAPDDDSSWPQPTNIGNFPVPSLFVNNGSDGTGVTEDPEEPPAGKHHSRKSHRAHKH